MTVLAVLAAVVFHALLAQSQIAIDQLDGRITQAQRTYEQVRLEHAQLEAPARIVARAAALGLVNPSSPPTAVPGTSGSGTSGAGTSSASGSAGTDGWSAVKPVLGEGS